MVAAEKLIIGVRNIEGVEFDFSALTVRDFRAFQKGDIDGQINAFVKIVTLCPWGDPKDEDTYLDLNVKTEMRPLVKHFEASLKAWQEAEAEQKKD